MIVYVISKTQLFVRTLRNVTNIALGNTGIYTLTVMVGDTATYETYSSNDYYIQISILKEE